MTTTFSQHGCGEIFQTLMKLIQKHSPPEARKAAKQLGRKRVEIDLFIEVGSFYGWSTVCFANQLNTLNPNAVVLAIDPWSGDQSMWLNRVHPGGGLAGALPLFGRATIFDHFMVNIADAIDKGEIKKAKTVLPFSVTSLTGARWLQARNYRPSVVFLDSAHE